MIKNVLTASFPSITEEPIIELEVSESAIGIKDQVKKYKCKAIFDTGATSTVLTKRFIEKLQLKVSNKEKMIGVGAIETKDVNTYFIDIYLPIFDPIRGIKVYETETEFSDGLFDILIGMDIMRRGDFLITNYEGKTQINFRIPSKRMTSFINEALNELNNYTPQKKRKRS